MNKSIIAIFCIFLIVSSLPVSAAIYGYGDDTRDLGEALVINVDHIEPTPIRSDYFQNREFNAYVFLNGKTLGTMLFGDNPHENAPFFGDMKIKNIQLTPNKESSQYIAGNPSEIVRPKGEEIVIDSNGNINLGYTRVRFKRMSNENEVPDTIDIDVSARIYFDVDTGFGSFGTQSLNLKEYPNEELWKENGLEESKIWGGRGYLRVVGISGNTATVQLYDGGLKKVLLSGSEKLVSGDEAKQFHLPGAPTLLENFLTIKLDRISRDPNTAKLMVENLDTKTVSTTNVVKGMKPFTGSLWEIKEIYSDRVVFVNEDGDQKILDLARSSTSTEGNPCQNFGSLDTSKISEASSSELYCEAIREYQKAIDFDPVNKDLIYQSYIGIAKAYDGLSVSERALEYYQLAKNTNPTKFEQEYNIIFEGVQRRIKEKFNYFILDNNVVSLESIDIGGESNKNSFTYFEKDYPKTLINKSIGETLIAGATDESGNKYNWVITGISSSSITIEQAFIGTGTRTLTKEKRTIDINKETPVPASEGTTKVIYIDKVTISESAIITISPGTKNNYGTSTFTIHVPIEKRLWDWTPEEIDKLISSTEKSMVKLDKIIDRLGNVIKTWKLVCFSTFAILSVKNAFFRNPASKLAQERASQNCLALTKSAVGTAEYNECYNSQETQDQIKRDTESSKSALDDTKEIMDGFSWENDDQEGTQARERAASELGISEEELMLLYRYQELETEGLSQMIHNKIAWNDQVEVNSWTGEKLESARKIDAAVKEEIGDRKLSKQEIGLIEYKWKQTELGNFEVATAQQRGQDSEDQARIAVDQTYGNPPIVSGQGGSPLGIITENGREYVYVKETYAVTNESGAVVKDQDGKIIYGDKLVKRPVEKAKDNNGAIIEGYYYNSETGNVYLGGTVVNNYMVGYQGLTTIQYDTKTKRPLFIPFSYQTKDFTDPINTILGYGNFIKVDESAAYHYSVWNPGPDGMIGNTDDEPVISSSQLHPDNRVLGMDRLASQIERAYTQASVGSGKPGESITIGLQSYTTSVVENKVGNAQGNCEDIMTPGDCKILYNVCDPVMCPPSRFNLGGRWNVLGTGSVVQKGIIGSLVLGWGNGDLLPICLTGIHAGLENIYSMLGSFRDCLETSRVSGESVGICNEIRSLYMCDIIWEEALALVNVAGKLSSWVSTTILGKSGGGEYKFWDSSWTKLGSSVSFFTKDYASSAFAAFTARSTDEIGSELCKAAIFGKFPAGGDLLGQLTSPESPPQFTGWFEEDRFTDVNLETGFIPSSDIGTGQSVYRIYYHIYAGRDRDINYRVVLKNIAGQVIPVTDERSFTSGKRFLKAGETVDKSFVLPNLPPGFVQMCIIIDEAEHCGFGSISSSFSAEYLKQQIVAGAVGKIENAEDCIPEQRTYIPGALTSGIRRVCSVYDPDSAGDEWEYVGTCGFDEQGRNLGNCYLYAKGVKQSIIDSQYNLGTVLGQEVGNDTYVDKEKEFEVYLAEKANTEFEEIKQAASQATTSDQKVQIIERYHNFAARAPNNDMSSESYYNVGELIRDLATQTFVKEGVKRIEATASSCNIEYDGGSGVYDDATFLWTGSNWYVKAKKPELKTESIGTKIVDLNVDIKNEEDCKVLEDHKEPIYDICKFLVGTNFENGVKKITEIANIEEVNLKVIKDDGSKYEPEKRKISSQAIIALCLSERITSPSEEFAGLVGKPIEIECKTYSELAGKDVIQTIYFNDGVINVDSTTKSVSTMDEFVDFVYGICYDDGNFDYIKVKKEFENYERTIWKKDVEEGSIDVNNWLKSVILGEFVEQGGEISTIQHPAFNLKLYREGGIFGIDTKEDYTFVWNGFMLEKMIKSQGNPDESLNIVDWNVALNIIWLTWRDGWRDIKKVEFWCANSQTTKVYTMPTGPLSIDAIGTEFKKWLEDSSNECGGRVITGNIQNAIQLANSEVIVNRKCDCGTSCDNYAKWIEQYSSENGVDPILILALMMQESQCMADVSSTSSHGLMQINSKYHCDKYGLSSDREECSKQLKENPEINIRLGVEILKSFYDIYNTKGWEFNGCNKQKTYYGWEAALRAYNGPGCDPRYPQQDDFVENVMERYNYLLQNSGSQTEIILSTNPIAKNAQEEYLAWGQGSKYECESGMQDELTSYWEAVGWKPGSWVCDKTAWSAAFISYVVKESGVNFPFNSAHSRYFMDIKEDPTKYDCKTYDVQTDLDKIKIGDILCANREGLSKTYNTLARGDVGHCDVIIDVSSGGVKTIGGNVGNSVSEKTVTRSKIQIKGADSYYGFISCNV